MLLIYERAMRSFVAAGLSTLICGIIPVSAPAAEHPPQNIIVILADDLRWDDLPFFSEPVLWGTKGCEPSGQQGKDHPLCDPNQAPVTAEFGEGTYRRPDLNRTAARLMAMPDGHLGNIPSDDLPVVPVDLDHAGDTTAANFQYAHNPAVPSRDVLLGFGGLGRIARQGAVMSRYYSTSALCAPARTAFITGRHQQRADIVANGQALNGNAVVTFAELLKQGCKNGAYDVTSGYPQACYHTGFFGKWNPAGARNLPWAQGFDEFVGFKSAARPYISPGKILCSPAYEQSEERSTPRITKFCQPWDGIPELPETNEIDYRTTCNDDSQCSGLVCSETDGKCFNPNPDPCTADWQCGVQEECRAGGRYVGRKNWKVCPAWSASQSLECCSPPNEMSAAKTAQRFLLNVPKKKKVGTTETTVSFATSQRSGVEHIYCDNDAAFDRPITASETRGAYSDRLMRDFARNFLIRRLYEPDVPFLLVLAPKAAHETVNPPLRTIEHYQGVSAPADPKYWATIEELDAIVGTLVELIDGMCDKDSPQDKIGNACQQDTECGGGATVSGKRTRRWFCSRTTTAVQKRDTDSLTSEASRQTRKRGACA